MRLYAKPNPAYVPFTGKSLLQETEITVKVIFLSLKQTGGRFTLKRDNPKCHNLKTSKFLKFKIFSYQISKTMTLKD